MGIPETVTDFLGNKGIRYEVCRHPHSGSSLQTAISAELSPAKVAKGVVFRDDRGDLLAVLPADHDVDIGRLQDELQRDLLMLQEGDLADLFPDCEVGAVPVLGSAYGIETVVDTRLRSLKDLYFEAGDHEELIHIAEPDFETLLDGARFISFSQDFE